MMLPLFLAVTEHAAPGPIEGLKETFEHFGVEPKFILLQLVSFLIVVGVLYRFAIKPTIAAMDERNAKIASGLKHAEDMQAKLAAAQQNTEAQLREAQQKAQAIVAEAQKTAKDFADKQQKEAIEKSAALIAKAQDAIELEKKKMLAEARTEIARLVVATTQRVLAKELTDADRTRFNESAARELTNV